MLIKLYKEDSNASSGVISISGSTGAVLSGGTTYGYIHVNAEYCFFCVDTYGVTIFDDSGVCVYVPRPYIGGDPMNIAIGFGANDGRLFGYGSFVEFVRSPLSAIDFNRCVALNSDAVSVTNVKSIIRFTHTVWENSAVSDTYYTPEDNPFITLVSGPSNNPCFACTTDYTDDAGYRTEIGITPIRSTLHGKRGALQRIKASADYYMASEDNPSGSYYTYIFQLHNAGFTPPSSWATDPPPLAIRVSNDGTLKAFVTYIANGAVPASDNSRISDEYILGTFARDTWMHLEVEARIGWNKKLAARLIIKVDGQERLNINTPLGFNITKTGGYVNTHFGNYDPEWHSIGDDDTKHREVLVTNIRWQGTQNIN